MLAAQLTAAFGRLGIPVSGVTIGALEDRETWTVQYKGATDAQQSVGAELLATFDPATDTDYLEERAEAEATAFLKKPSTQSFLVVMAGFFDAQVVDVQENLKAAYKQAYKDEHSL